MAETKSKKPPTIHESISRIEDQIVLAKSDGNTVLVKNLEKILLAFQRKRDSKKDHR